MADILEGKLNKAQLDLLALFQGMDLPEEEWAEVQQMVARYFGERAIMRANAVADEKGWTEADFHRMARAHHRYTSPQS